MKRLAASRVAVFGLGGVGGYAVEALARSGVGALDLVDNDKIAISNINRQIYATHSSVGKFKADVAAERVADIAPDCKVTTYKTFFLPSTEAQFDFSKYDYVVDAIDTVAGKLALIKKAKEASVPIISAMGAGNKLDPTAFEVADISKTSVCPLAKIMRRELRKLGIDSLKVVYSKEEPKTADVSLLGLDSREERPSPDDCESAEQMRAPRRAIPGSVAFVPPVMGMILAAEVIKDLTGVR